MKIINREEFAKISDNLCLYDELEQQGQDILNA